MTNIDANSVPTLQEWETKNNKKKDDVNMIPSFNVTTTVKKFGKRNNRVKVMVFGIECAKEDARYLKTLLLIAYEKQYITTGTFIQTVYHLITSHQQNHTKKC
eukprot:14358130-Ditylum_brightwellii.AAC.1